MFPQSSPECHRSNNLVINNGKERRENSVCLLVCFWESRSLPFQPSPGSFSVFPSHHSGASLIGPTFWPDSGFAVCVVGKVLPCSLGCPGICSVDQAILELTASRLPLVLESKARSAVPQAPL